MNDFEMLESLFTVLGSPHPEFVHPKFTYYYSSQWMTPSFSPLILSPDKTIEASDLDYINTFFQCNRIDNPVLQQSPYFNFLPFKAIEPLSKLTELCYSKNWKIDPDPLSINIFLQPKPITIPTEIYLSIHPFNT